VAERNASIGWNIYRSTRCRIGFCSRPFTAAAAGRPKDSSAGAIAASGLLDLAEQTNRPRRKMYRETALTMLDALCDSQYLAINTPGWEGILKHAVYHTQKN